jgi:hypothetical protein
MSTRIVEVVGALRPRSFLELGTFDGKNFRSIPCDDKVSVDTNGHGTFTGTTDEFFFVNKRRFDVCFIDADHSVDAVIRDFNNAILCCDKAIVLHDLVPGSIEMTAQGYCGDAFRLLYHLWRNHVRVGTLNCDCGLTVVKKADWIGIEDVEMVSYSEFAAALKHHQLLTLEELIEFCQ